MLSLSIMLYTACDHPYIPAQNTINLEETELISVSAYEFKPVEEDTQESSQPTAAFEEITETTLLSYAILYIDSSDLLTLNDVPWADDFSFSIIQVEGMEDTTLQKQINENIQYAMTHWIEESFYIEGVVILEQDYKPTVYLQSDRFLSFSNDLFYSFSRRTDRVYDVITIDMRTGEKIMLNDLVNINTLFVERIIEMDKLGILPTDAGELLKTLSPVSLNIDEAMFITSFYLKGNQLIITPHRDGGLLLEELYHIAIDLNEISEFLLVEKW